MKQASTAAASWPVRLGLLGALGALGALGLALLAERASVALPSSCADACYRAKSVEYQRCRTVPTADRAGRVACFQRADAALHSCLRRCR